MTRRTKTIVLKYFSTLVAIVWAFALQTYADEDLAGPWDPDAGLAAYTQATGRPVYFTGSANPFEVVGYKGQCTWFAYAVWGPEALPCRGNAIKWLDEARAAGWPTGSDPQVPSIAVWGIAAGPYGHAAMVTNTFEDGTLWVWDSNWHLNEKVYQRRVTNKGGILGYIYGKYEVQTHLAEVELSPRGDATPANPRKDFRGKVSNPEACLHWYLSARNRRTGQISHISGKVYSSQDTVECPGWTCFVLGVDEYELGVTIVDGGGERFEAGDASKRFWVNKEPTASIVSVSNRAPTYANPRTDIAAHVDTPERWGDLRSWIWLRNQDSGEEVQVGGPYWANNPDPRAEGVDAMRLSHGMWRPFLLIDHRGVQTRYLGGDHHVFFVDRVAPEFGMDVQPRLTSAGQSQVTAWAREGDTGVTMTVVHTRPNGTTEVFQHAGANATFTINHPGDEGRHRLEGSATDGAGNTSEQRIIDFVVDHSAPAGTLEVSEVTPEGVTVNIHDVTDEPRDRENAGFQSLDLLAFDANGGRRELLLNDTRTRVTEFVALPTGTWRLELWTRDQVDNRGLAASATVTIPESTPELSSVYFLPGRLEDNVGKTVVTTLHAGYMDGSFMPVVPDSLMVDPGDVATARSLGNGRVEVTIIKAGTAQLTASYGGLTATAEIVGLAVVDVDLTVKLAGTADWQGIGLSGGKVRGVAGVFLHAGRRERCYLRLTNTSSAPGVVRLRGQQVTGITTTYLAGEDVTAQVLHLQGWKTPKIAPGESLVVELSLAIPSDYPAGNKRQIKVWLLPAEASSSLDTVAVQMTSGPPL